MLELHRALDGARHGGVQLRHRADIARHNLGMCDCGDHILMCFVHFQCDVDGISNDVHPSFKPAEIGAAECASNLEGVVGIPLLVANKQVAPQCSPCRSIKVQRTKAVSSAVVATRIENELHTLNASSVEGCTAHRLAGWEALPEHASLFQAPLYPPHHSRPHSVHLALDLVEETVVHMPSEQQRPWELLCCHLIGMFLLSLRGTGKLLFRW
mmetsp:Transcript_71702/g.171260  ORF Transcript_71702/g.171260 Transcript_71702/m.171260 type:complete len:212 (-) Transcript_71702:1293-1928(-)